MAEHLLKCWPAEFDLVDKEIKRFEFRKDDRGYRTWDRLTLQEFDPETERYSGREVRVEVQYILREGFGVPDGFVVMSIRKLLDWSAFP